MELYFGTIVRGGPVREGGSLFRLNWDDKSIVREAPIVPADPSVDHDPNARGNVRGCRGIQVSGDQVIAADYHSLHIFDRDLNFQRKVSNGLMVGLHEIQRLGDSVWVTSTTIDAALKCRLEDGAVEEQFWPREMPTLQEAIGTEPLAVDKQADNRAAFLENDSFRSPGHLHLNAVCEFNGEVYALLHSKCVVVNLGKQQIVIQDERLKHAHNLIIEEPGLVWINDTRRMAVRQYDLASGRELKAFNLRNMPGVNALLMRAAVTALRAMGVAFFSSRRKATARPLFLRGLAMNEKYIFAGFSPATIMCIEKESGRLVDTYFHSNDARVCIHGLALAE
jgi:hypothetical protein